jgi:hypothetical protein
MICFDEEVANSNWQIARGARRNAGFLFAKSLQKQWSIAALGRVGLEFSKDSGK